MTGRLRECSSDVIAGRRRKAFQFAEAFSIVREFADDIDEVGDVCATLAVHAGIAASDVVCCAALGYHHHGDDHRGALSLLAAVDPSLSRHLKTLLDLKTLAGYSHQPISGSGLIKAGRAMNVLVLAAQRYGPS